MFASAALFFATASLAQEGSHTKKIKVFIIGSTDRNHSPMVKKAEPMFQELAKQNNFEIYFTRDTAEINSLNLARYQVFIQLSIAYFDLSKAQQFAIQQFVTSGKGWIGIHGAGLTGKQFAAKDGKDWNWYWHLLGDAPYSPHPPLQDGVLKIENTTHPVTKNLPASFSLRDEWYEFENPPVNAMVLAVADESTYKPNRPMGYHPMIWTNPDYNRALYISVGHDTTACTNESYKTLLTNAVKWAGENEGYEQKQMDSFLQREASILTNQIGYTVNFPKRAMFKSKFAIEQGSSFSLVDAMTLQPVYVGKVQKPEQVKEWDSYWYSPLDFSDFNTPGFYKLQLAVGDKKWNAVGDKKWNSFDFEIGNELLTRKLIPAIANFFEGQKANSKEELLGDANVKLFGSEKTVNLQGGWCDASGDVSKYFSHLAYTNYMNPQQIPMVDWSMIESVEAIPGLLKDSNVKDSLILEAFYGADYIMKSLSPEGYFYMTLFSYFKKDPKERRVVGLLADSKTTTDYQSGYREGGGMGVASLARISRWQQKSKNTQAEYLKAAERAFEHLQKNSIKYIDDHKENILDDYSALMASTELKYQPFF